MKRICLLGFLSFLFAFMPVKTFGCSCTAPSQIEEFRNAESVFIGQFIETTKEGSKIRVVKSWKGTKTNKVIYLNIVVIDCGLEIDLVKGNEFLFYLPKAKAKSLFEKGRRTFMFICGRSSAVKNAQEDIKNMDKIASESRNR